MGRQNSSRKPSQFDNNSSGKSPVVDGHKGWQEKEQEEDERTKIRARARAKVEVSRRLRVTESAVPGKVHRPKSSAWDDVITSMTVLL